MKLGIANRIDIVDVDLADTQDVTPSVSGCLMLISRNAGKDVDALAQSWLDHQSPDSAVESGYRAVDRWDDKRHVNG